MSKKIICPYCEQVLDEIPKRSRDCQFCGKTFYVRNGKLLTKEDVEIIEWLGRLTFLNISKEKFDLHRFILSNQFGFKAPVRDVVWRILNVNLATSDHNIIKMIYYEMAYLLKQEQKDPRHLIQLALKHELLGLKEIGVYTEVKIQSSNDNDVCPECKSLHGKIFDIDEALESLPIPSSCTCETGCRCYYIAHDIFSDLIGQ